MKDLLEQSHLESVRKSYLNIVAMFLHDETINSRYLKHLLKWGFQLHLTPEDLKVSQQNLTDLTYSHPDDKVSRLEAIYHLVYMIYIDEVMEDVELEIAMIYAEKLGFKQGIVSELFKSIATADFDSKLADTRDVRAEVLDFLKLNDAI